MRASIMIYSDEPCLIIEQTSMCDENPCTTIKEFMHQVYRNILEFGVYYIEDFVRDLSDEIGYYNIEIPGVYAGFGWCSEDFVGGTGDLYRVCADIVDGKPVLVVILSNLYPRPQIY